MTFGPPSRSLRHAASSPTSRAFALIGLALLAAGVLSACGSSGGSSTLSTLTIECRQVGAVLGNGPDPEADPVGYAQAQVLPLRRIHGADRNLDGAITKLADAYEAASHGGTPSAKVAVAGAVHRLDAICPEAAS
jgi:hypothetical protein